MNAAQNEDLKYARMVIGQMPLGSVQRGIWTRIVDDWCEKDRQLAAAESARPAATGERIIIEKDGKRYEVLPNECSVSVRNMLRSPCEEGSLCLCADIRSGECCDEIALEVREIPTPDNGDSSAGTADDELADFIENAAIRDCKQFRFALKNAAKRLRQNAELRECLKETINAAADAMWWKRGCDKTRNVCTNCSDKDKTFPCPVKRWRKALEGGAK